MVESEEASADMFGAMQTQSVLKGRVPSEFKPHGCAFGAMSNSTH
jgi:hypothetical protein